MIGEIAWIIEHDPHNSCDKKPYTAIRYIRPHVVAGSCGVVPGSYGKPGDTVEVTVRVIPKEEGDPER